MAENNERRVKPRIYRLSWPQHGVTYLPEGWFPEFGTDARLNVAADAWCARWNAAHRDFPPWDRRSHNRLG